MWWTFRQMKRKNINDVLRYTALFEDNVYRQGVDNVFAAFKKQGYDIIMNKNYWETPYYKGINSVIKKGSQKIEVQFHTPESIIIKEKNHKLYEVSKLDTTPAKEKGRLKIKMQKNWEKVTYPNGISGFGQNMNLPQREK